MNKATETKPKVRNHDCAAAHRYHVDFNRAVVPVGTRWACPTCDATWVRTQEVSNGVLYLMGYKPVVWVKLNWWTKRNVARTIRNTPDMERLAS